MVCLIVGYIMDVDDKNLLLNHDWDPAYLYELFKEDFFDFGNMDIHDGELSDSELLNVAEVVEKCKYVPIVEDITMDDHELSRAVAQIESE